jgi:hypothetical protein
LGNELDGPEVSSSLEANISISEDLKSNVEVGSSVVHSSIVHSVEDVVLSNSESCSPTPSKWSIYDIENVSSSGSHLIKPDFPSNDEVEGSRELIGSEGAKSEGFHEHPLEVVGFVVDALKNWNVVISKLEEGLDLIVKFVLWINLSFHDKSEQLVVHGIVLEFDKSIFAFEFKGASDC